MADSKLYTGYGDGGYTQTLTEQNIPKYDDIIVLLGTIDECSAGLGVAKAQSREETLCRDITAIQEQLIGVMGEIAGGKAFVDDARIHALEEMTDRYNPQGMSGFSIPGANVVSAQLDVARTIVRRAERTAAKLYTQGRVGKKTMVYLNRLSDVLYAMARWAEQEK